MTMDLANKLQTLNKASDKLRDRGLQALASEIDKISDKMTNIKIAQYVGVQGYHVRNRRCFDNCIRHKRASGNTPHDAWMSCFEEYSKYNDNMNEHHEWSKYATNANQMLKDSSQHNIMMSLASEKQIDQIVKDVESEFVKHFKNHTDEKNPQKRIIEASEASMKKFDGQYASIATSILESFFLKEKAICC